MSRLTTDSGLRIVAAILLCATFVSAQSPVVDPASQKLPNPNPVVTIIKQWGRIGSAPGEFRTPHALAFDSRGRLFVADRGNHRIRIFDQGGTVIASYVQFSRVSGLFITPDDMLYAIDSERQTSRPIAGAGLTKYVKR